MATMEMHRPQARRPTPRKMSLVSPVPAPASPTIIRTNEYILLPSMPTHEPEDYLPSPSALQRQFVIAAQQPARKRQSSLSATPTLTPPCLTSVEGELDELEEMAEQPCYLQSVARLHTSHDVRSLRLDAISSVVNEIADSSTQSGHVHADPHLAQLLDDIFASLRRMGGNLAPLSPQFARIHGAAIFAPSDLERLSYLVDKLIATASTCIASKDSGLLVTLADLTKALTDADPTYRSYVSPPRTPSSPRSFVSQKPQRSPAMSDSRASLNSERSYCTVPTPSDDVDRLREGQQAALRQLIITHKAPISEPEDVVPFQHHVDGSVFDMTSALHLSQTAPVALEKSKNKQLPSLPSTEAEMPSLLARRRKAKRNSAPTKGPEELVVKTVATPLPDTIVQPFTPSRRAPIPPVATEVVESPRELRAEASLPPTPTASSSRKSSIASSLGRKLSIASIAQSIRRASVYDISKDKERDNQATVRRRPSHDPRVTSDIVDGLSTLFSSPDSGMRRESGNKSMFRAINFADDTPKGRHRMSHLLVEENEEDEEDYLQDYSFASIDTVSSNRHSFQSGQRSPASSPAVSRRQSRLLSITPVTAPKSPLTPLCSTPPSRKPSRGVSFAHESSSDEPQDHSRRIRSASLQTSAFSHCKSLAVDVTAPTTAAAVPVTQIAAAAAATDASTDMAFVDNSTDLVRPLPLQNRTSHHILPSNTQLCHVVETQHSLGHLSILLWLSTVSGPREPAVTLRGTYRLVDAGDGDESCTLLLCFGDSSSSGGGESEIVRVALPASARCGQTGIFSLTTAGMDEQGVGPLVQIKLDLSTREKHLSLQISRSGYTDDGDGDAFPLSTTYLTELKTVGLECTACRMTHQRETCIIQFTPSAMQFQALPSQGWEELVDAWMCHTDQHLNRTLTETAVRFTHRMAGQAEQHPSNDRIIWVGDTYLLVPSQLLSPAAIKSQDSDSINIRCRECNTMLSESSSSSSAFKLSKYTLQPSSGTDMWVWAKVLLTALAQASASTGTRKFLLKPEDPLLAAEATAVWLFTVRTSITTSTRLAPQVDTRCTWKGSKLLYRPANDADAGQMETIHLPQFVYTAVRNGLYATNAALHPSMRVPFPTQDWFAAFLLTPSHA